MPNPFEQLAGKAKGKAKAVKARLEGLTGVFARLAEQHGEASALLERLKASDDSEKREDLWTTIRAELLSHERAELSEVYPEFAKHAEMRQIAQHHAEEAGQLETLITELDGTDTTSDMWDERIEQLISMIQHHVDEEEHEYFPKAQKVIGKDGAKELDSRYVSAQDSVKAALE